MCEYIDDDYERQQIEINAIRNLDPKVYMKSRDVKCCLCIPVKAGLFIIGFLT